MTRFIRAIALILCLILSLSAAALADSLGPARSYDELLSLAASASDGDVILVSGEIVAAPDAPLSPASAIRIRSSSEGHAVIGALCLRDAFITFDDIDLRGSLTIEGTSAVELTGGVSVSGADGREGIRFTGGGTLLLDSGSLVVGGSGSAGVAVSHESGDFYGHLDGTIRGGSGSTGGVGVEIAPLQQSGALMISGVITGGDGASVGGHALNLYGLSGNAYVTLDGTLRGGDGYIGGNGAQIVSAAGSVIIGVSGEIAGGRGESHGGNALVLMNVEGGASISLTGALRGGDVTGSVATPGTSLLVVGDTTSSHTVLGRCLLEEGRRIAAQAPQIQPDLTPLPEIVPSVDHTTTLADPSEGEEPADAPDPSDIPDEAGTALPEPLEDPADPNAAPQA